VGWIRFFTAVLPELTELARELFKRHQGDVKGARAEIDARLEQLRRDRSGEH
jgi:hypothetical protein